MTSENTRTNESNRQQRENAVRYSRSVEGGCPTTTSHRTFRMACRVRNGGSLIRYIHRP